MLFSTVGRSYHPRQSYGPILPSNNTHGHPRSRKDKEEAEAAAAAQFWGMVAVVGVVIAALSSAFIALYYLLNEVNNSISRFIYNEGWMQALISLSSIAASGFTSFIVANAFVTSPLIGLAITAGLTNPAGIAVLGVSALSLVGAAAGGFLTNLVQNYIISSSNQDALDPNDPYRFELTDKEVRNLIAKRLDPIKVKCAIIALRAEIGKEKIPGFIDRLFIQRGGRISECLNRIRQLRKGNLDVVGVGPLTFDCHQDEVVTRQVQVPHLGQRSFVPRPSFADVAFSVMPPASVPQEDQQKPLQAILATRDVALDLNVGELPPSAPPSDEPVLAVPAANGLNIDDEDDNPRPITQFG
jgi:hypothetical protein